MESGHISPAYRLCYRHRTYNLSLALHWWRQLRCCFDRRLHVCVSLFLCPTTYLRNHTARFRQIFVLVACSRRSVLLRYAILPVFRMTSSYFHTVHGATVGGRAFPVAGPSVWNNLPDTVTLAPTLSTFHQRLKTYLFSLSYPDIILDR